MEPLLDALRAIAEPTRLRVLALCAHGELTVSDLVRILGQSQPRVSRHLRLLVEAGLLERHQEGNWARYRLSDDRDGPAGSTITRLSETVVDLLPGDDLALTRDLERLEALRQERDDRAADYFADNADDWDRIRALHVDEAVVTHALESIVRARPVGRFLDLGTGTGHVLRTFAADSRSAIGVDLSPAMLSVARAAIERDGLRHCQVRLEDIYRLPYAADSFDTITAHMVLHYAEAPDAVIAEAARVLAPGGRLILVDFAAHNLAALKAEHRHVWPGFSDARIAGWFERAGLEPGPAEYLEGGPLTVCIWSAEAPTANAIREARG